MRASTVTELQSLYNYVIPIDRIGNPSPANLYLMNRPDLLYTFTKIHLWRMTQFRKIIYIDSDVVALRAPDELFDTREDFAAAPDVGWPDAFNTGVMVLSPNEGDYDALRTQASAGDSFDGADQGLLNQYFEHRPWKRLSFTYNCTPSANYQYEPAYRYYKRDIKLVHFIGKDKPWQQERLAGGGVHQELLGRWWAVYDRHFKVSTYEYASTGRREPVRHEAIQQHVKSEEQPAYYATGYPADRTEPAPPPAIFEPMPSPPSAQPASTAHEMPFGEDPQPPAEAISQGHTQPVPTQEQRKYSMQWDATHYPPPAESKPEASNFPSTIYEFSADPQPFRPPAAYPEPPRDMWYEVPKDKPKPLPAIFPWEERKEGRRPPARVFVDDELPPPEPEPEKEDEEFRVSDELEVSGSDVDPYHSNVRELEQEVRRGQPDKSPWEDFGRINKNAWDEVSGIEDYVRALTAFQKNRGKVQVVAKDQPATIVLPTSANPDANVAAAPAQQHVLSPSNQPDPEDLVQAVSKRRESLLLTDFPSAIERPSLPVTPAPRRRSTFWGEERDEEGELPAAEGVPDQSEWNPDTQLDLLRRSSLIGPSDLKMPSDRVIPKRKMPSTAVAIPEEPAVDEDEVKHKSAPAVVVPETSTLSHSGAAPTRPAIAVTAPSDEHARSGTAATSAPAFAEPVFGGDGTSGEKSGVEEEVLSPTDPVPARSEAKHPTIEQKEGAGPVAEAS